AARRDPGHRARPRGRPGLSTAIVILDCMPEPLTLCGRMFGSDELELMRQMARDFSALGVTEIARTVCELLEWKRPRGGLRNQECGRLLERLRAEGFLNLPEVGKLAGGGPGLAALL